MLDLNTIQTKIIEYIDSNYERYLSKYGIKKPQITTDFIDLDKYKNNFTLFIDFNKINFNKTKFTDDCSRSMQFQISIYLVFRNNTSEKLKEIMLDGASAFYSLMNNTDFTQEVTITELNNYNIVEGSKFIVISEFTMNIGIEI